MRRFDSKPFAYFPSQKVVLSVVYGMILLFYGGALKDKYPLAFFFSTSEWII